MSQSAQLSPISYRTLQNTNNMGRSQNGHRSSFDSTSLKLPNANNNNNNNNTSASNNNNDSTKDTPSKNLSHVPCKFYRQGACQAGNSCPFSHTLDPTSDTAPCKYFQKGNCKFGVKCALAHILPDGRRVNPKTLAQVYQNHSSLISNGNNNNNNKNHSAPSNGYYTTSVNSVPTSAPISMDANSTGINSDAGSGNGYHNGGISPSAISPSSYSFSRKNSLSNGYFTNTAATNSLVSPNFHTSSVKHTIPTPTTPTNGSSGTAFSSDINSTRGSSYSRTLFNGSSPVNNIASSPFGSQSIWSTSNNSAQHSSLPTTSSDQQFGLSPQILNSNSAKNSYYRSLSHSTNLKPTFVGETINESAILDDEDEDARGYEEDLAYEEDLVPSSLSDLLTPQELKRRGSKPTSVKPVVLKTSRNDMFVDFDETPFKMDDEHEFFKNNGSTGEELDGVLNGLTI